MLIVLYTITSTCILLKLVRTYILSVFFFHHTRSPYLVIHLVNAHFIIFFISSFTDELTNIITQSDIFLIYFMGLGSQSICFSFWYLFLYLFIYLFICLHIFFNFLFPFLPDFYVIFPVIYYYIYIFFFGC